MDLNLNDKVDMCRVVALRAAVEVHPKNDYSIHDKRMIAMQAKAITELAEHFEAWLTRPYEGQFS